MIFSNKGEFKAEDMQIGGTHYKEMGAEPWGVLKQWLTPAQFKGFLLGTTVKYLARVNVKDVEGKGGAGNRETFLKKIETRSPYTRIDKAVLDFKVIY